MADKPKKDPALAGILSFFIPGLGQIYAGKSGRGIILFAVTIAGYYLLVIPGIILHIITIWDAVKQAKRNAMAETKPPVAQQ